MKNLLALAVLSLSVSAHADWTAKIQCKTVKGKALVAKAQGTLQVIYDADNMPSAEMKLTSVTLLSSYGAKSGSTFKDMTLQSVEMTTQSDYVFGTLLPIVDHMTINRFELYLGDPGAKSILETNKGNKYFMSCSFLN